LEKGIGGWLEAVQQQVDNLRGYIAWLKGQALYLECRITYLREVNERVSSIGYDRAWVQLGARAGERLRRIFQSGRVKVATRLLSALFTDDFA